MKTTPVQLFLDPNEIDIDIVSEEVFDYKTSIAESKNFLSTYNEEGDNSSSLVEAVFEEDNWSFRNSVSETNVHFNFEHIENYFTFNEALNGIEIKNVVKTWVVSLLRHYYPGTAQAYLKQLKRVLFITGGLQIEKADELFFMLENKHMIAEDGSEISLSDLNIYHMINSIRNFLDYYPIDSGNEYLKNLSQIEQKLNLSKDNRTIPSSKDVFAFAFYLDKWLSEVGDISEREKILFYPVVLWWKITSIIPLRSSEFCNIERNSLYKENGNCYLKLPRLKQPKKNKVQIIDTIGVSDEIHDLIEEYIELTDSYGNSKTLVSYAAIEQMNETEVSKKLNKEKFSLTVLRYLISRFYKEILMDKYHVAINPNGIDWGMRHFHEKINEKEQVTADENISYDIERMIRPNDTRHLAIISLMLQGYDRIEIARLSGHTSLHTQYNYYNHVEFWVDSEVKRLADSFKFSNNQTDIHLETKSQIDSLFLKNWLEETEREKFYKLKLGYCCDEAMACPTFDSNFSGCYFCPNWWISKDELVSNQEAVAKEISEAFNGLKKSLNFLFAIYDKNDLGDFGEFSQDHQIELKQASKRLSSDMLKVAKLKNMLGGLIYERRCEETSRCTKKTI